MSEGSKPTAPDGFRNESDEAQSPGAPDEAGKQHGDPVPWIRRQLRVIPNSFQAFEDFVWDGRHEDARGPEAFGWRWVQIIWLAATGVAKHNSIVRASALTFTTILSSVPLLAVAFSILTALGVEEKVADQLIMTVTERLSAGSEEQIETALGKIEEFIKGAEQEISGTNKAGLAGIGVLMLLGVSISMLTTVEGAFNIIWDVKRGRAFMRRITNYVTLMVLAPFFLFFAMGLTAVLHSGGGVDWMGPLQPFFQSAVLRPLLSLLPYLSIWAMFVFCYYFMPNHTVRWASAIAGGVLGGTLWQIAQIMFIKFSGSGRIAQYDVIYGGFAWAIVLLTWVYFSWIILLAGAEISHAHQNLRIFRRIKRTWSGTPMEQETLALRLSVILTRPMLERPGQPFRPTRVEDIADELRLPPRPIEAAFDLFTRAGLTSRTEEEAGFVFCRSPHDLTVLDILRLVREGRLDCPDGEGSEAESLDSDMPSSEGLDPGCADYGILAEVGRGVAQTLHGRKLADLADVPIEQIRTFGLAEPDS